MTLNKIYRIVAENVDATMPSEEVMNLTKQVSEMIPDDEEEVLDELECLEEDDEEETDESMSEDEEEGYRQDPDFRGLCEEQE
jgi:gas vesicle protein